MPDSLTQKDWDILVQRIKSKNCTPFLGAGAAYGVLPLGAEIAREWAQKYEYPLDDPFNLIDDFMTQALRSRDKDARQELCRWNKFIDDQPSSLETGFVPTVANPVVFHLHGHIPIAESLVLTEDDYMDFLVNITRNEKLLPQRIQKALMGSSLLFIGYRISDWNFRVLLKSLAGFLESGLRRTHFAVITPPTAATDPMKQKAQDYLSEYYENIDVRVYWGTAREFTEELRQRL